MNKKADPIFLSGVLKLFEDYWSHLNQSIG